MTKDRHPKGKPAARGATARRSCKVLAVFLLAVPAPILAHHSYVMFKRDKVETITATVAVWQWTNPHIYLRMKLRPDQPEIVFEGHSPSIYRRAGLGRTITAVGSKATVTYHPMANGSPGGQILTINGKGTEN